MDGSDLKVVRYDIDGSQRQVGDGDIATLVLLLAGVVDVVEGYPGLDTIGRLSKVFKEGLVAQPVELFQEGCIARACRQEPNEGRVQFLRAQGVRHAEAIQCHDY